MSIITKIQKPEQHYRYNHNLPSAEDLLKEHADGSSWRDIASKYDAPENTLWSRIKNYRDALSGKRKPIQIRSGEDNGMFRVDLDSQKMVEDYEGGMSTTAIAAKYACGKTTVKRKLRAAGVVFRVQVAEPKPPKVEKIKVQKVIYPTGVILENSYSAKYWNVIETARSRTPDPKEYYEVHHAYPKALGGGNETFNLVYLTAKEHYVCHHLLTKCTQGDDKRKMVHAWLLMAYCDKEGNRYVPAVQYQHLRRELAAVGKSEEHKAKIGAALKGRKRKPFSEEAKRNMSAARREGWAEGKYTNSHHKGVPKSDEQRSQDV